MTDQRPIDVSTLRDGDVVRAKRGEYGVVEGVLGLALPYDWAIFDQARGKAVAHGLDGWTITDILRPMLVKGDRVVWTNVVTPKQGTYVGLHEGGRPGEPHLSVVTNAEGRDIIVETDFLTRLPTAPEPAPIEVGGWWAKSDGTPVVIVRPDTDPDFMQVRQWDEGIVRRNPVEGIRQLWTCLDGPPEPPAGTIGVVGALVFQTTFNRGVAQMDGERSGSWATFLAQSYVQHRLATLQIVHTLGVE